MGINEVNGADNSGYNKITLYDKKTAQAKTYFIPIGKKLTMGNNTFDLDKAKNHELVITGSKEDTKFNLTGLALEHLDSNQDGKIDKVDNDSDMASKINKKLENTPYYVKEVKGVYSDAGIAGGEGGVVFSLDGEGQFFGVDIE